MRSTRYQTGRKRIKGLQNAPSLLSGMNSSNARSSSNFTWPAIAEGTPSSCSSCWYATSTMLRSSSMVALSRLRQLQFVHRHTESTVPHQTPYLTHAGLGGSLKGCPVLLRLVLSCIYGDELKTHHLPAANHNAGPLLPSLDRAPTHSVLDVGSRALQYAGRSPLESGRKRPLPSLLLASIDALNCH